MSGRELFGVIVRTLGALFALWGIYTAAYGVLDLLGFCTPTGRGMTATTLVFGGLEMVVGAFMLFGGNLIVRLSYGRA